MYKKSISSILGRRAGVEEYVEEYGYNLGSIMRYYKLSFDS